MAVLFLFRAPLSQPILISLPPTILYTIFRHMVNLAYQKEGLLTSIQSTFTWSPFHVIVVMQFPLSRVRFYNEIWTLWFSINYALPSKACLSVQKLSIDESHSERFKISSSTSMCFSTSIHRCIQWRPLRWGDWFVPESVLPGFAIGVTLSIDINIEFKPDIMIQGNKNHTIQYYPSPDFSAFEYLTPFDVEGGNRWGYSTRQKCW